MGEPLQEIEPLPCACVSCDECRGTGHVWFTFGGHGVGRYLGASRQDDLDEMETCFGCDGSGLLELCDRCAEIDPL